MNPNMANREVINLEFYNYSDKKYFTTLDFANVTTTDLSASRVTAKGGQGAPERVSFDGERKGTLKVESQITTAKLYSMLSGTDLTSTAIKTYSESLTAVAGVLTLTETPLWAASVGVFDADGVSVALNATTPVSGKTVTLSDTTSTDTYTVKYLISKSDATIQTIKFTRNSFPKAFFITGTTLNKTEDEEMAAINLVYYKAVPQATFTLTNQNTGDPMSLSITCDLLFDKDGNQFDMSIIDETAA